jgi:transposase, IS6 family
MRLIRRTSGPAPSRSASAGFRFQPEVIVLAVHWLRFGLSYRDVEELLAARGIEVNHVTVHRWVQHFSPLPVRRRRRRGPNRARAGRQQAERSRTVTWRAKTASILPAQHPA